MPSSDLDNVVYWSELNDAEHDRSDRMRAQPSDSDLQLMWSIYSGFLLIFSLGIMVIFFGIITNRKVRQNPFNKYILFLSFPDFMLSGMCFITCLLSALNHGYSSWQMCQFQTFYLSFGTTANSWLNGVMAWEVYRLLRSSHIRRRYFPPTDAEVYRRSALCYSIAIVTGFLPLIAGAMDFDDWFPTAGVQSGFMCDPTEQALPATLIFWFVMSPLIFGIPYILATYIFMDVLLWSKLLPPQGKRRELSIYFFRIGAMFVFLWAPTFFVMFVLRGVAGPWWVWGIGAFSHLQGLVSALLTLYKQDIREAVWDFVRYPLGLSSCCCGSDVSDGKDIKSSQGQEALAVSLFRKSSHSMRRKNSQAEGVGLPVGGSDQVLDEGASLPIQGADFQFLDERPSTQVSEVEDTMALDDVPLDVVEEEGEVEGSSGASGTNLSRVDPRSLDQN
jgi:hypothetical protein